MKNDYNFKIQINKLNYMRMMEFDPKLKKHSLLIDKSEKMEKKKSILIN